jgi:hypothetical protein
MRSAILASVLLVSAAVLPSGAAAWATKPAWCNGLNCPNYTTVASCPGKGFDIREYPASQYWVGSTYEGAAPSALESATQGGFMKGFRYISGANADKKKIEMTCPVLNKIVPGAGPNCNTTFTVSFFLPYAYQSGNAPAPTEAGVSIFKHDKIQVAVRSFGGFTDNWTKKIQPQFLALGESLQKASIAFSQKEEWLADYDSPFHIFDRHNEVMYPTNMTASQLESLKC